MIAGIALGPLLRAAGGRIVAGLAWLADHPWQAALLAALGWLAWLQLVTLPDRAATIAAQEQAIAARTGERDAERAAHLRTKQDYAAAQAQARALEQQRLARVEAEQQEINDDIAEDYRRRLAAARADAERLRGALRPGAGAAGAAGGLALPGAGAAPGGAAQAAGDRGFPLEERLIATEQALQLSALIEWVERQAGVDPNR